MQKRRRTQREGGNWKERKEGGETHKLVGRKAEELATRVRPVPGLNRRATFLLPIRHVAIEDWGEVGQGGGHDRSELN